MDTQNLEMFLYLLIRDSVTMGEIERIMKQLHPNDIPEFSNKYLAEYAKNLAERILDI